VATATSIPNVPFVVPTDGVLDPAASLCAPFSNPMPAVLSGYAYLSNAPGVVQSRVITAVSESAYYYGSPPQRPSSGLGSCIVSQCSWNV
jgi:hypothetical protein